MFRPNLKCRIQLSSGNDVYGQPKPTTYVSEGCSVVKLILTSTKSTVRADSSASRGNAMEIQAHSVILLSARTKASINDIIEVSGSKLRIEGVQPRYDTQGRLDHYEINASVWSLK